MWKNLELNNIQVEKHTAATTMDENLEILREWIVKGSKPASLECEASTELRSYYSNFEKFKLILGHVYREVKNKGGEIRFHTSFQ